MEIDNTNQTDSPTQISPQNLPPQNNPLINKKGAFLPILGIILLLLIVGGEAYLLGQRSNKTINNNNQSITPTSSPATNTSVSAQPQQPVTKQKISFISDALYIADSDGSNKELIYKPHGESDIYLSWDWSPDNQHLVTSAGFIVNLVTKQQVKTAGGRCHNWSPDGKKIIYEGNGISIMDVSGQNAKQLFTDGALCRGSNDVHHWLPDSNSFIYTNNAGINKYSLTTNTNSLIYDSNKNQIDALSVSVSKDGNQIVFVGRTKYNQAAPSSITNIYTANIYGTNIRQLTNLKEIDQPGDAMFTPDGRQIIFSVNNAYSQYNGLSVLNIQDKSIKVLSSAQADSYYPPNISSDGQFVSYDGSSSGGTLGAHIINLQTGKEVSLPEKAFHVLWSK